MTQRQDILLKPGTAKTQLPLWSGDIRMAIISHSS